MNPLSALIIKQLNGKLEQLHNDNKKIIALLETIAEKDKIVIKVFEKEKKKVLPLDRFEQDLWWLF